MTPESYRILHAIDHLGLGGAQTFLLNLCSRWSHHDKVSIIGLGGKNDFAQSFAALSNVEMHGLSQKRFVPANLRLFRQLLRSGRFDIVHCHLPKSAVLALLSPIAPDTRLIIHEHGQPSLRPWPYHAIMRRCWRKTAAVIANARGVALELEQRTGIPNSRMRVVPNGICMERFVGIDPAASSLRARLGFPADAIVMGCVGRLAQQKGVSYFLDALARIQPKHTNIRAVIVGEGPLRASLENHAANLGLAHIVHFAGFQANVEDWMHTFDVGVVPSLWEPFGISAIELMASGVPVVATDVDGLKENISHELTGLLVAPKDSAAMAAALERLITDKCLRRRIAGQARAMVAEHFSIENVVRQIRQVYDDVCQSPAQPPTGMDASQNSPDRMLGTSTDKAGQ